MFVAVGTETSRSECVINAPDVVEEDSFFSPVVIAGEELGQLPWIFGPSDNVVGEASVPTAAVEGRLLLHAFGRKVKGTAICALRVHRSNAVVGHDRHVADDLHRWAPSAGVPNSAPFVCYSRAIAAQFEFALLRRLVRSQASYSLSLATEFCISLFRAKTTAPVPNSLRTSQTVCIGIFLTR